MRITTRLGSALTLVAWLAAGAAIAAEESLRIVPFVRDHHVLVSFELDDAYTPLVHETISSGLKTTFSYDLELRTVVPGWIDRTIARTEVMATDQYDNLTRRHMLTRIVDGVEETLVTQDEAAVKAWLLKWTRVRVSDTSKLDPTRDYYVRITTHARPLGGSMLGLTKSISASAKFTFIP